MKITATNKATGELIELEANNQEEIVTAWRVAQEYVKAAEALKDQLKRLVPEIVNDNGLSSPIGNYQFRVSSVQRMNYDKAVMRQVFDPDTLDVLLRPDKSAVDRYLKENLERLEGSSTALRTSMLPEGTPYQIIRLEKLTRGEA